MKKTYFLTIVLGAVLCINAQEGKVGINTEMPQETLEIKGTLRVTELPTSGGKIYGSTTATVRNTNFTPTKMVVANANGVLGTQDFPTIPTVPNYEGSTSILLENNQFLRAELTGDVTAEKNNNATKVVAIQGRNISDTNPNTGQVLKWNGSAWAPANDNNDNTNTNIYSNNGTLSSNRVVTMGNNTLTFTGNNTSFIRNGEAISVKGDNHSYIGYYKANNTTRSAYTGFASVNANDFTIKNQVANGKVVIDNQTRITDIPVNESATEILVTNANGDINKRTLASIKDELQRVNIEKMAPNTTKDLSSISADQLKDTYIIDKSKVILPTCDSNYFGKEVSFYKWGGATGLLEFTTNSTTGGMFNHSNTQGFNLPTGMEFRNNILSININSADRLNSFGFRSYRFICIEGDNKWFLDFGFR